MTIESHATAYPLIYPPRCRRPKKKLAQEKTCHVGQITCICSPSQEFSPRREIGRGLFDSDGDPHSRAHSPCRQRIAARRAPKGRRPNLSERFPAKACAGLDPGWIPVRVKKTRQIKK